MKKKYKMIISMLAILAIITAVIVINTEKSSAVGGSNDVICPLSCVSDSDCVSCGDKYVCISITRNLSAKRCFSQPEDSLQQGKNNIWWIIIVAIIIGAYALYKNRSRI